MIEYTPEQVVTKMEELRKPFPEESIGFLPKGGAKLRYCGHAAVTDRLNRIDPHWYWEPFALDENGLPALDYAANGSPVGLWIKFTCLGKTIPAYGDAMTGKTIKELIGDAIRSAAMRFGVALELWSKDELESTVLDKALQPVRRGSKTVSASAAQTDEENGDAVTKATLQEFIKLSNQGEKVGIKKLPIQEGWTEARVRHLIGRLSEAIANKNEPKEDSKVEQIYKAIAESGYKGDHAVVLDNINNWLSENEYDMVESLDALEDGLKVIIKSKIANKEIEWKE